VPRLIVLLSGPVGSGKTTLCTRLKEAYSSVLHVKTGEYLKKKFPAKDAERRALQEAGETLDRRNRGAWVRDCVSDALRDPDIPDEIVVIVDAVRISGQVDAMREAYGRKVIHVHLTAPREVLERRYRRRKPHGIKELASYGEVIQNFTEAKVEDLKAIADVVIDTKRSTPEDVETRVAAATGFYGRNDERLVDVLIGGQYGSEGKGQIAAFLAPEYDLLVRVGGPNAGHSVHEFGGKYVYHHLPSGTRASSARLLLAPGCVIGVSTLLKEIADCNADRGRLVIDRQAMVISPDDIRSEQSLVASIGSTGQGVGAATARKIRDRMPGKTKLAKDIPELAPFVGEAWRTLEKVFAERKTVLLEGTQGTALSLHHGYYPHVTSRDTTVAGCLAEAGISPSRVRRVIMVCRTYPIRVQSPKDSTSGPMLQETKWREVSRRSGLPYRELVQHEVTSTTHRSRRVAEFDWLLLRKAASLNAPTDVALTFADYLSSANRQAQRFDQLSAETIRFVEEVERVAGAPVSLISTRFHSLGIIDRRSWGGQLRQTNVSGLR